MEVELIELADLFVAKERLKEASIAATLTISLSSRYKKQADTVSLLRRRRMELSEVRQHLEKLQLLSEAIRIAEEWIKGGRPMPIPGEVKEAIAILVADGY